MATASTCHDGAPQVVVRTPKGLSIMEFLEAIDPEELAAAALQVSGGLAGPTVGEAFLIALKTMAGDDGA